MTEEELKNKCKERAKIFQQAMESCKSSSPMDCIEWFADRIAELEKENAELKADNDARRFAMAMSEKVEKQLREENAELKKLKQECETSLCRAEYQYNYEQLTKAKEIIKEFIFLLHNPRTALDTKTVMNKAEQFLKGDK